MQERWILLKMTATDFYARKITKEKSRIVKSHIVMVEAIVLEVKHAKLKDHT